MAMHLFIGLICLFTTYKNNDNNILVLVWSAQSPIGNLWFAFKRKILSSIHTINIIDELCEKILEIRINFIFGKTCI